MSAPPPPPPPQQQPQPQQQQRLLLNGAPETRRQRAAAAVAAHQGYLSQQQQNILEYTRSSAGAGGVAAAAAAAASPGDSNQPSRVSCEEVVVSKAAVVAYNTMVAAMNEHLSSSAATTTTTTTTSSSSSSSQIREAQLGGKDRTTTAKVCNEADDSGSGKVASLLGFPCDFDHMYASMTDGSGGAGRASATGLGAGLSRSGEVVRQGEISEVRHLKELLLLHLDLIQQQSEQIVTKDKLLAALRQENEMLKLRIERSERRVNLQKQQQQQRPEDNNLEAASGACSPPILNPPTVANSLPSTSSGNEQQQQQQNKAANQDPPLPPPHSHPSSGEGLKIRLNTSGGVTTVKQESPEKSQEGKKEELAMGEAWDSKRKRKADLSIGGAAKRRRGASSSSTVSNGTGSPLPETNSGKESNGESSKKSEKKSKSQLKKECFLTTEEHYYTAVGEANYSLRIKEDEVSDNSSSNLEVPSWRVKVYTSCYTMEGTENLDDEIFNKRHLKLENDERRRKRWDFQRIREQRHIEKLKQRQERQSHLATCSNINHTGPCGAAAEEESVKTLWPEPDQLQLIQVDSQLPISAFGAAIPTFTPCEFSLPWLLNAKSKTRHNKRSNSRRKKSRR